MTIYPVPKPKRRKVKAVSRLKKSRIKKYNAKRKGHLFPRGVDEARRAWIRRQPCHVLGLRTGAHVEWEGHLYHVCVVPAHVKSRGSSGIDRGNMIPLASFLHDWQGQIGWSAFEKRAMKVPRKQVALAYEARYVKECEPCP